MLQIFFESLRLLLRNCLDFYLDATVPVGTVPVGIICNRIKRDR